MGALIRCVLHLEPNEMTDEEFARAWGQVKFFTELAYQIKYQ
jgi:hypothetical protein